MAVCRKEPQLQRATATSAVFDAAQVCDSIIDSMTRTNIGVLVLSFERICFRAQLQQAHTADFTSKKLDTPFVPGPACFVLARCS